jgi:thiol:disulfide interchange protein DsbD
MSVPGVLIWKTQSETGQQAYEVALNVTSVAQAARETSRFPNLGLLLQKLFLAFLGGLILNVMPCVFPVIALKILGFVQQSKESPAQVFRLGMIYALGVVASFLVMGVVVIAVKQAGGAASWGMQMQNPQFTLLLTVLVTLVALNLFGVFEVNLSGHVMGAAGQLASRQGAAGAFLNGVLATVLATPCTAPFLAPALGFAFAQPHAVIIAVLVAVALGLAFPYILLSWRPQWLKFLPRPGAWMEKFKVAMGFPMLATAVWLFSFTARRFGHGGPLWLGLFLVVSGLSAWIWGQFVQQGSKGRGVAACLSLLLLAVGYGYALEKELHWRSPTKQARTETSVQTGTDAVAWQKWSPGAVEKARAEGRPVLVDFTADWCVTCKCNELLALGTAEVRAKLKEINAAALVGDNTDNDPAIVAELKEHDRAGVPLVLVYPRDRNAPPIVLPALLTKGIVLDALAKATK